jgi:hypothetical protein
VEGKEDGRLDGKVVEVAVGFDEGYLEGKLIG